MYLMKVNKICSIPKVAHLRYSQRMHGERKKFKKLKFQKTSKNEHVEKDENYMDILKKAEKAVYDPSERRLARTMYQLTRSMTVNDGKVKLKTPVLRARRPIVNVDSFSSPFTKLFANSSAANNLADIKDISDFSIGIDDEELKRLFLYQECLANEDPYNLEIPTGANQSNFLMKPHEWEVEMTATTPIKQKAFKFLMLKWAQKNRDLRKKEQKSKKREQITPLSDDHFPNKLFPRFNRTKIGHWNVNKHICSIHHSQPLVIDMRFHKEKSQGSVSLMRQMLLLMRNNFDSPFPFHLVLSNFEKNTEFYEKVWKKSTIANIDNVIINSEKPLHYLEPEVKSEDLIYLTPDAAPVMHEFDHSKVYVIGGLVDRYAQKYRTKTISKTESINAVRLPLHLYLRWGGVGGKMELTVNIVFDILNTLKHTGSWIKALSCIPYRLHQGLSDLGKELANYDPEIIAQFDAGRQWKSKQRLKTPNVYIKHRTMKATSAYLGK